MTRVEVGEGEVLWQKVDFQDDDDDGVKQGSSATRKATSYGTTDAANSSTSDGDGDVRLKKGDPAKAASVASKKANSLSRKWSVRPDALRFAARFSVTLTLGSLFMLVPLPPDGERTFPSGLWVFITVIFVSWYPTLDAASVTEKAAHRIAGTVVGGALAVATGTASTTSPWIREDRSRQAVFLGGVTAAVGFAAALSATSRSRSAASASSVTYAHMITVLTYGIAVSPFSTNEKARLEKALWRVTNVCLGCLLSCFGAFFICPRSTGQVVTESFEELMTLTGDAAEAVLTVAADTFFGEGARPRSINQLVREGTSDDVRSAYLTATDKLRATKSLLRHLDHDPLRLFHPYSSSGNRAFVRREDASVFVARNFRVLQNIILVDSLVRNHRRGGRGRGETAVAARRPPNPEEFALVRSAGRVLRALLRTEDDDVVAEADAFRVFRRLRAQKHEALSRHARTVTRSDDASGHGLLENVSEREWIEMISDHNAIPFHDYDSEEYGLVSVLGMIEHLMIRSIRLRYAWKWFRRPVDHGDVDDSKSPPDAESAEHRTSGVGLMKRSSSDSTLNFLTD